MNPQPRILVVDDDETVRALMLAVLGEEGYQVHEAADGNEALACVGQVAFDLIIVDWLMPILDGCTFFDLYRRLPQQHAAVVLCSAVPGAAQKLGGNAPDAFLLKPFDVGELCQCVKRCLGLD